MNLMINYWSDSSKRSTKFCNFNFIREGFKLTLEVHHVKPTKDIRVVGL